MILQLILARLNIMQDSNHITLDQCAALNEVDTKILKNLFYNNAKGNSKRFKKVGGTILVHKNYQAIFFEELSEAYYKALIIAKSQANLSREIAKLLKKKPETIERYFIRFTFKHIQTAEEVLNAIHTYLKNNSLVETDQLEYSDEANFFGLDCAAKIKLQKIHEYKCEQPTLL